jgi:urease accessory protein
MNDIISTLRLLQFGDSTLPVGGFAFSNGLESAIQTRLVHDAPSLEQFVATALAQVATADGIALLQAHRSTLKGNLEGVKEADWQVFNRKMNEEVRTMTVRMGTKLVEMAVRFVDSQLLSDWSRVSRDREAPCTYPIAQAVVLGILGIPEAEAFAVHQYGLASMILSAALRLMKIGHLETQAILFRVNSFVPGQYDMASRLSLEDMATFAPLMDIFSAVHTKASVRLFMS